MRNLSVLLVAVVALLAPSVSRSADPTLAADEKIARLSLPPKVACPMFNMGQWGGSPNMWYAVFCVPDSGATALTLPEGASASECGEGEWCVGGLSQFDAKSKVPIGLSKGYPGPRLDPSVPFKTNYVTSTVEDWYVKINIGTTAAPMLRTAKIFRISAEKQTAMVPLSQFHSPPSGSPEAVRYATKTVPIPVQDFRAIVGFEVDGTDVGDDQLSLVKYSEKIIIQGPNAPVDANAYRVLFQPRDINSDPILAEVLMKE